MKTIKVRFVDFWPEFDPTENPITEVLQKHFDVRMTDEPDFLVYSNFGYSHLDYSVPRIFFTSENIRPDFNICDYALGCDRMAFGDRYFRFTVYMFQRQTQLHSMRGRRFLQKERRFCNFVYSNPSADPARDEFFHLLSKYKPVDSAGAHLNTTGFRVKNKQEFQKNYKFTIAFENSSTPGYCTEKLIDAYVAGTVPIYWGDPDVGLDFNENAFVNCHAYSGFDEVIQRIIELDRNDAAFAEVYEAPFLSRPLSGYAFDPGFEEFLMKVFNQDPAAAFRRNRQFWGRAYETQRRKFAHYITRLETRPFFSLREHLKILGLGGTIRKVGEKRQARLQAEKQSRLPDA
jgi:hypothetical protein